jgi:hypothetical protein
MKIQELGVEEMARFGATHRVIVKAEDLTGAGTGFGALTAAAAASTTGTLVPFVDLPAGKQIQFTMGYLKTRFTATTATNLTMAIGYDLANGTDKAAGLLSAVELLAAGYISYFPQEIADVSGSIDQTYGTDESTVLSTAIANVNTLVKNFRKVFSVVAQIQLAFTATAANLTDLLTGEVHLYFRVVDLTTI